MKAYYPKCRQSKPQRPVKYREQHSARFFETLASTTGERLPPQHRQFFNAKMGMETAGVRVHNRERDHQLAEQIHSRAFTYGSDIFFNKHEFAPGTIEGDRLLAHELTHARQGLPVLARKPKPETPKLTQAQKKKNQEDIKSRDLFWKDMSEHFDKDQRKLAGSNTDDTVEYLSTSFKEGAEVKDGVETIYSAPIISVGRKYLAEPDVEKRKSWIRQELEKIDAWRFDSARIDDADLANNSITPKITALNLDKKLDYIQRLMLRSKFVPNEKVKEYIRKLMPSTPQGPGAVMEENGGFRYQFGNISIQVLPDEFDSAAVSENAGETSIKPISGAAFPGTPAYNWDAKQKITTINPIPEEVFPVWTVQTRYGKKSDPSRASAYGYGTRDEDTREGTSSLRFHEGAHGQVFIDEIRNKWATTPYPSFTGAKGDSKTAFETKLATWVTARDAFKKMLEDALNQSTQVVDCTGKSIVKYSAETGKTTKVTCP